MEERKKKVLVAVVRTTPSILTETAWALALRDVQFIKKFGSSPICVGEMKRKGSCEIM